MFLLLCQIAPVMAARMYQWQDPATGTTQLSGTPPAWYRSDKPGPRVLVFEKGQLLDDTGRMLPEPERQTLRQQALMEVEKTIDAARVKAAEAERLRSEFARPPAASREQAAAEVLDALPEAVVDTGLENPERESAPAPISGVENVPDAQIEQMREIIRQWEAARQ